MRSVFGTLLISAAFLTACTASTGTGTAVSEDTTQDSQLATDDASDATVLVDVTADATADATPDATTDATAMDVAGPDVDAQDAAQDVAGVSWTLFTLTTGGFCAPGSDCFSTWTVSPDGAYSSKKQGKLASGTMSSADLAALHAAIDPLTFLEKMKNGFVCGIPPTDVGVSFHLALFGVEYDKDVTGCAFSGGDDGALVQGISTIVKAY